MAREMQITEDTTALVDHASRLLGAIETGSWAYGRDKIDGLRRVLDRLEKQLNPEHRPADLREVNAASVWATVGKYSSHFWLGRAIFSRRFERATETLAQRVAEARRDADAAAHFNHLGPASGQAALEKRLLADALFAALVSVLRVDDADGHLGLGAALSDARDSHRAEELVAAAQKRHEEAAVTA